MAGRSEKTRKSTSGHRLDRYRGMRRGERTPEPMSGASPRGGKRHFVIQKHSATALHYDFRLEAGGVLKSWAVPKGPSTDPRDKRLAIRTEDHPVDYLGFEGAIPSGEYGAGKVIVWDTGTYLNLAEKEGRKVPVAKGVGQGHVKVWLEGEKLRGGYALTRTGREGARERWILIKLSDEGADARRNPASTEPASVRSGRTLDEIPEDGS